MSFVCFPDNTYLNLNLKSLSARRHIRLGHQPSTGVGLRLHGTPHSKSSSLHRFAPPLPCVATLFWGGPPSGVHPRATAQSSVGSFLSTWQIQFHHLLLTSSLIFSASVISRTVLFEMCCCHRILKIFLRHDWCPF